MLCCVPAGKYYKLREDGKLATLLVRCVHSMYSSRLQFASQGRRLDVGRLNQRYYHTALLPPTDVKLAALQPYYSSTVHTMYPYKSLFEQTDARLAYVQTSMYVYVYV